MGDSPLMASELAAALEAGLHPRVVGSQVASAAVPAERAATRVDRADTADELG